MYVMERDFDFQIKRIMKLQKEEIEEKEEEIDYLRNDNYIISNRNMNLFKDIKQWGSELSKNYPENEVSE